jgi:hypothetical protein
MLKGGRAREQARGNRTHFYNKSILKKMTSNHSQNRALLKVSHLKAVTLGTDFPTHEL